MGDYFYKPDSISFKISIQKKVVQTFITAMGNLRPFKLFNLALLRNLKYDYLIEKLAKPAVKVYNLALDMAA
jgi:hypothetical protein